MLSQAQSGEWIIDMLTRNQYNAILELAAEGNDYASGWAGPPQGYNAWGQAAALDNLVSAITSTT